jgi:hypothetical protein
MLKLALIERLDLANGVHGECGVKMERVQRRRGEVGEKEMWSPRNRNK